MKIHVGHFFDANPKHRSSKIKNLTCTRMQDTEFRFVSSLWDTIPCWNHFRDSNMQHCNCIWHHIDLEEVALLLVDMYLVDHNDIQRHKIAKVVVLFRVRTKKWPKLASGQITVLKFRFIIKYKSIHQYIHVYIQSIIDSASKTKTLNNIKNFPQNLHKMFLSSLIIPKAVLASTYAIEPP